MNPAVGDLIMASRLLVLQSKRLLLTGAETRRRVRATEQAALDVERFESAVRVAHDRYNDSVLKWARPETPAYRLIAYSSLIHKAEALHARLTNARSELSGAEGRQLQSELWALERIIRGWRDVLRTSMAAVA